MGLAEAKADITLVRDALLANKDANLRTELTENVLPLLEGIVTAVQAEMAKMNDELADQGEAIDELIDGSGEALLPETGAKIIGLIEVGKALAKELEQLVPKLDDLAKKRVRELIKTYRQGAIVVAEEVQEIMIDLDEEEEEDTEPVEGEEPAEGDEGEEGDEEIVGKEQG